MINKNCFEIYDDLVPISTQEQLETAFTWGDFLPWAFNNSSNFIYKDKLKEEKLPYEGSIELEKSVQISGLHIVDTPQFTHSFIKEESGVSRVLPNLNLLGNLLTCFPYSVKEFIRIKMNMTFPLSKNHNPTKDTIGYPHVDNTNGESMTAIYYVNDSDGDTIIFNQNIFELDLDGTPLTIQDRITPKRGRFLVFNTPTIHAPQNPILSDNRVVINFNFIPHQRRSNR